MLLCVSFDHVSNACDTIGITCLEAPLATVYLRSVIRSLTDCVLIILYVYVIQGGT